MKNRFFLYNILYNTRKHSQSNSELENTFVYYLTFDVKIINRIPLLCEFNMMHGSMIQLVTV